MKYQDVVTSMSIRDHLSGYPHSIEKLGNYFQSLQSCSSISSQVLVDYTKAIQRRSILQEANVTFKRNAVGDSQFQKGSRQGVTSARIYCILRILQGLVRGIHKRDMSSADVELNSLDFITSLLSILNRSPLRRACIG